MALSGIFLMVFLLQHLAINLTSLFPDDGNTFNKISHFMGYNPLVQFVLQPILIFGVFFGQLIQLIMSIMEDYFLFLFFYYLSFLQVIELKILKLKYLSCLFYS